MYTFKGVVAHCLMHFFSLFPIQKKVVFSCFDGKSYGDNPKAIYLEMLSRNIPDIKYIWLLRDEGYSIPGAKVVRDFSIQSLYHLATSKIWIDNSRKREWTVKRRGQYYIQTWHGGLALKKIEKDAIDKLPASYVRSAMHDSKMADLFVAGNAWNVQNYKSSFWYDGEIIRSGLPRSDALFRNTEVNKEYVINGLNLSRNSQYILYAPTFRSNMSLDSYDLDYEQIIDTLEHRWGGKWSILLRLHPNIKILNNEYKYSTSVIDASNYPDINDLILFSDIIITDYSSCMFDAMIINKPTFLYTKDIGMYNQERGTYFSIKDLPFPTATCQLDLIDKIYSFDSNRYQKELDEFKERFVSYEDGKASSRIVDRIERELSI